MLETNKAIQDNGIKFSINSNIILVTVTAPNVFAAMNNNSAPSYSVFPYSAKMKMKKSIAMTTTSRFEDLTQSTSLFNLPDPSAAVLNKDQSNKQPSYSALNKENHQTRTYQLSRHQNPVPTNYTDNGVIHKPSFDSLHDSRFSQNVLKLSKMDMKEPSPSRTDLHLHDMDVATRQVSLIKRSRLQQNYSESNFGGEIRSTEKTHKKTNSSNEDVLESLLGIYPEKKKFGVGVSVADVVANKLFRRSQKMNVPFAVPTGARENSGFQSYEKHSSRQTSSDHGSFQGTHEVSIIDPLSVLFSYQRYEEIKLTLKVDQTAFEPLTEFGHKISQPSYDSSSQSKGDRIIHGVPVGSLQQHFQNPRHVSRSPVPQKVLQNPMSVEILQDTTRKISMNDHIQYDQLEAQRLLLEQRIKELQEQRHKLVQKECELKDVPPPVQCMKASAIKYKLVEGQSFPSARRRETAMSKSDVGHMEKPDPIRLDTTAFTKQNRPSGPAPPNGAHKRINSRGPISDASIQESVAIYSHRPLPPPPIETIEPPAYFPPRRNTQPTVTREGVYRSFDPIYTEACQQTCQSTNMNDDFLIREDVDEDDILGWVDDLKFASTGPPGRGPRLPLPYPTRADSNNSQTSLDLYDNYVYDVNKLEYDMTVCRDRLLIQNSHDQKGNQQLQSKERKHKKLGDRLASTSVTSGTFEVLT